MIAPTIEFPCPDRNLVAECTTTSAPCSIGRIKKGVATVLSTMSGRPFSWAIFATVSISNTSFFGFEIVSPKNALVLGRIALRHDSGSSGLSTKVTSMPNFGRV